MQRLHEESIIIDATCPLASVGNHYEKWLEGGVTAIAPTVAINEKIESTMHKIGVWYKRLESNPEKLIHVTTVEDIYKAKRENKLGIIFHFQNTLPYEMDLNMVEIYHKLGVRMVQLCYNVKNFVGDGCAERTDCGLSDFGLKVIAEMNRVGIVVDLSHTGYRTTMEAIEASQKPVIFSHSNVKALCDSARNIKDDQIKAVASKDGVVGINGTQYFVNKNTSKPSLDDLMEHIDYIVRLVGPEFVSIGLDYYEGQAGIASDDEARKMYDSLVKAGTWDPGDYPPPPWYFPDGIELPNKFPNLTEALQKRYSDQDVKNILGGNLIRVFKEVWT
jgi:membrane dipeptidase